MSYFERESGYESDYEREMSGNGFRKTDGFGEQHNALAYEKETQEGPHVHIGYDPKTGMSFYHGKNFETKHNKPESAFDKSEKLLIEQDAALEYRTEKGITKSQSEIMKSLDQATSVEELRSLRHELRQGQIQELKDTKEWLVGSEDSEGNTRKKTLVLKK